MRSKTAAACRLRHSRERTAEIYGLRKMRSNDLENGTSRSLRVRLQRHRRSLLDLGAFGSTAAGNRAAALRRRFTWQQPAYQQPVYLSQLAHDSGRSHRRA